MGKSYSKKGAYTKPRGSGTGPSRSAFPVTKNADYSTAQGTHESGYDDHGRGKGKKMKASKGYGG